jgi:hypothetical protein
MTGEETSHVGKNDRLEWRDISPMKELMCCDIVSDGVNLKWRERIVTKSKPVFLYLLGSPGIDSQPVSPVRQPYLTYKPARLHRLAESNPGLLKRLQKRALASCGLSQENLV